MRNNYSRSFINCLAFFACFNKFCNIMAVYFNYSPAKCAVFFSKWFEWHNILCHSIHLNAVAIYNSC